MPMPIPLRSVLSTCNTLCMYVNKKTRGGRFWGAREAYHAVRADERSVLEEVDAAVSGGWYKGRESGGRKAY